MKPQSLCRGVILFVAAIAISGGKLTPVIAQQDDSLEAVQKRVSAKVERVTEIMKKWAASGRDPSAIVKLMQEKVGPLMDAGKVVEAEPELDRVLKALGQKPDDSAEAMQKRLTGKVERVTQTVKKWAASGRDPSAILKTMQEKVGPLLDAGKGAEAEAELDRVLKALGQDPDSRPESPVDQSFSEFASDKPRLTLGNLGLQLIFRATDSPVGRLLSKMHLVQKLAPDWAKRGGDAARLEPLMRKVSQCGDKSDFAGAEKTADEILSLLGASDTPRANVSEELHRQERDAMIATAKKFNLTGIEDYVGWAVVEPEREKPNWSTYREDAAAIKKAGFKFVPFLWIQSLPTWVKNDPRSIFTGNVTTGLETEALSIFAPQTHEAYDHFFGDAKHELGGSVEILRIGSPYDFGETSYPAAAAGPQFPMKNLEPGFWVNEAPARAHFKKTMKNKFGAVEQLNAAWGTSFASFECLIIPKTSEALGTGSTSFTGIKTATPR